MLPSRFIHCPYCGEAIEIVVDDSVDAQRYVEDCSVCCRPIEIDCRVDESGEIEVHAMTDTDA